MPAGPPRSPAVGQSWRYAKRSGFSGRLVDNQLDQVAKIGGTGEEHTVEIDSRSEAGESDAKKAWGSVWLSKYTSRNGPTPLPSEIQEPWGSVTVDPHWREVQVYETPIPLWPTLLQPGWSYRITTKYKTPTADAGYWWEQTMVAQNWESITVPAGHFRTLRFTNMINFTDTDLTRTNSKRKETVWFAPEIGRWVRRESSGSYYLTNSGDDRSYEESAFRWELVSFT